MPLVVKTRKIVPTGATPRAPMTPMGINSREYQAMQGMIKTGVDFAIAQGQKIRNIEMTSDMTDFSAFVNTQKMESAKFRMENEDVTLPDGKTSLYSQDWDTRQKAIEDYAGKMTFQETRDSAIQYVNVHKPIWEFGVEQASFASKTDTAQRKFIEYQDTVLTEDYDDDLRAENSLRKQNGLPPLTDREYRVGLITQKANELADNQAIDQEAVPKIIANFEVAYSKAQEKAVENVLHEEAKAMPYPEAITFLNNVKGLSKELRNDLIARRKRQNEIETATTNRKVRWDTISKIGRNPEGMTDDVLEALVKSNSLTWDDVEELKKVRDTDSPMKRPAFDRGLTAIEEVMDAKIKHNKDADAYTIKEETDDLNRKQQIKNEFETWVNAKDRTDDEIEKKVKSLTKIPAEKVVLSLFNRIMRIDRKQLFGLISSEEEVLAKKKMKALEKEDVWAKMTNAEKESARKRFERGDSLNSVLKLLEQ